MLGLARPRDAVVLGGGAEAEGGRGRDAVVAQRAGAVLVLAGVWKGIEQYFE